MKKLLFLLCAIIFATTINAQGKSQLRGKGIKKNPPTVYWNVEQEYEATCPANSTGTPVTVVVLERTYQSTVSQSEANSLALSAATTQAIALLECTPDPIVYQNTEQSYTANCPGGTTGDPVQVIKAAGTYQSFISVADANAIALAAATNEAEAALVCTPTPTTYTNTEQSYTAECDAGDIGDPVTVTKLAGTYISSISIADANSKALAAATAEAEAALACTDVFYNEEQTYRAECPQGYTGTDITVTKAANTYQSYISVEDANALALAAATTEANNQLQCAQIVYWNIEQSYTASCPDGYTGDDVTVTKDSATYSSSISVNDANAQALAAATTEAKAALSCTIIPTVYWNTEQQATAYCPTGYTGSTTYTIPANTYSSFTSVIAANQIAKDTAQLRANEALVCTLITTQTVAPYPVLAAPTKPSSGTVAPGEPFTIDAAGVADNLVINYLGTHGTVAEAGSGEYFSLTGENLNATTKVHAWDGDTLTFSGNGNVLNRIGTFKNPTEGTWRMAVAWLVNGTDTSAPFFINKANPVWCDEKVYTSDTAWIYGVNLAYQNGTSTSYVWVVKDGTATQATVLKVDPYRVGINPASLSGTYTVYVHNGSGGDYGFALCPTTLTVNNPIDWGAATTVNVVGLSTDMTLSAANSNTAIIDAAISTAGTAGTPRKVVMPAGTYYISNGIGGVNEYVWFQGAGMNSTYIKLLPYTGTGSSEAAIIAARTNDAMIGFSGNARWTDMTLDNNRRRMSDQGGYEAILRNTVVMHTNEDVRVERVRLDCQNTFASDIKIFFDQGECKQIQINDCEFITSVGLYIAGSYIQLRGNRFLGTDCVNQMVGWHVQNGSSTHNLYTNYGTTLLEKAKGRADVINRPTRDCYFAHSRTVDFSPPGPDDGQDITPLDESAWGYKEGAGYSALSTTSLQIGPGTKTLQVGTGKSFTSDDFLILRNSNTNKMLMDVWSYNSGTGVLEGYVSPVNQVGEYLQYFNSWSINAFYTESYVDFDDNAGENWLVETFATQWRGTGASVPAANQITLPSGASGDFDLNFGSGLRTAQFIMVNDGVGKGQLMKIISVSGLTATLESNWVTQPNSSSVIVLGNFSRNLIFYDINSQGNSRAIVGYHKATTSVEPYGGTCGIVVDGITATLQRNGVYNYALAQDAEGITPHFHHQWKNITITNSYNAVSLEVSANDAETRNSTGLGAMIYRNINVSSITNKTLNIINSDNVAPKLMSGLLFQNFNFTPTTTHNGVENFIYIP